MKRSPRLGVEQLEHRDSPSSLPLPDLTLRSFSNHDSVLPVIITIESNSSSVVGSVEAAAPIRIVDQKALEEAIKEKPEIGVCISVDDCKNKQADYLAGFLNAKPVYRPTSSNFKSGGTIGPRALETRGDVDISCSTDDNHELQEEYEQGAGKPGWYRHVNWDDDNANGWTGSLGNYSPDRDDAYVENGDNDLLKIRIGLSSDISRTVPTGSVKLEFSDGIRVFNNRTNLVRLSLVRYLV